MMAGQVQAPEKELRFTRSGQAVGFWLTAAVLTAVTVTLLATSVYRDINPALPHPAWAAAPALLAACCTRLAVGLTRHAYVILTPLGLEIFPFFRPAAGMRLVVWQEIHSAEADSRLNRLTLHHDAAKSSGIHLSLRPLSRERRALLAKAVIARLEASRSR